jgi:hypothetical protein
MVWSSACMSHGKRRRSTRVKQRASSPPSLTSLYNPHTPPKHRDTLRHDDDDNKEEGERLLQLLPPRLTSLLLPHPLS